jgi:nucleoid-associated protein YgaU
MTVVRRVAIIGFIIAILLVSFGAIGGLLNSTPTAPTHTRPVASAPATHKPMADHIKLAPIAKAATHHITHTVKRGGTTVKRYVVKAGDSLWTIAQHHLGNGNAWHTLFQLNHAHISNPNVIHVGQVLTL